MRYDNHNGTRDTFVYVEYVIHNSPPFGGACASRVLR